MRNRKVIGVAAVVVIAAATAGAFAYAPSDNIAGPSPQNFAVAPRAANLSFAPWHKNVLYTRVAQSCIAHGQACVLNGTACCNAADTCKGPFPNTTCQ